MDDLQTLLNRGVDKVYPTHEELEKVLRSGKKLTLYQGFDPTGTRLHIGHMVGLRKLSQWQKQGHKVIFLIGDFTAMVGDPSGKTDSRKMLSREDVENNAKFYKEQAGKILNFSGENPIEVKFNSDWLGKMSGIEFIRIAGLLSVQQVMERDLFQERQKSGQDVYMNEFLYPVMQAYDSVAMNVDLEVGGSDQTFNMLMGRKLMRHMLKKDKFVVTIPLLTDSEGRKIGKTEGNVIGLTDAPIELYRKIMTLGDDVIVKAMEYLTDIPMSEIERIKQELEKGANPIDFKKQLAYEVTKQLNSEEDAKKAQSEFERVVQNKELPESMPELEVTEDTPIDDNFLVNNSLANSKSDAKRLFEQNGVSLDSQKIKLGEGFVGEKGESIVLRVGKKMIKLKVS